jgi:hypothetical protein
VDAAAVAGDAAAAVIGAFRGTAASLSGQQRWQLPKQAAPTGSGGGRCSRVVGVGCGYAGEWGIGSYFSQRGAYLSCFLLDWIGAYLSCFLLDWMGALIPTIHNKIQ